MFRVLRKIRELLQRSDIENKKRPLRLVQPPSDPDSPVMLHSGSDLFYLDPSRGPLIKRAPGRAKRPPGKAAGR